MHTSLAKQKTVSIPKNKDSLIVKALCSIPNSGLIKCVTTLRFDKNACTNCHACIDSCPMSARLSPEAINGKCCIRCYACVTVYPQHAIWMDVSKLAIAALVHHQKTIHKDYFYSDFQ